MINHRDRLLHVRQVNPDHRAITRQHPAKPRPPCVTLPVPPCHALTLLIGRPPVCAWTPSRTIAPGGRSRLNRFRQTRPPHRPRPITTPGIGRNSHSRISYPIHHSRGREQRSAHDALQVLIDESWKGRRWVVETDIANCFEAIPHDRLMQAVEERVCDRAVLALVRTLLRAGVMEAGRCGAAWPGPRKAG